LKKYHHPTPFVPAHRQLLLLSQSSFYNSIFHTHSRSVIRRPQSFTMSPW